MMSYRTIISAKQLFECLDEPRLIILDCRFNLLESQWGQQQYNLGHIANSQYAHLDQQLAGEKTGRSGRHPLPDKAGFQQQLRDWGVEHDSQIVVYDEGGGAIAARAWWLCVWAGIKQVALLDGGLAMWNHAGYPLSKADVSVSPSNIEVCYDDSLWVDTDVLMQAMEAGNIKLTDARTQSRYNGEQEPIDPVAGHVPGAENYPFQQNLDEHGCFLSADTLRNIHGASSSSAATVSMCGSGVTACHNILARAHAGLHPGKLYVGSWSEWITDKDRPVATLKG